MQGLVIPTCTLDSGCEALRLEVRAFLARQLKDVPFGVRLRRGGGGDPAFSRALGERGWLAMTWPKQYGGHERSALERYVVIEELLVAGAPVSLHWSAERQHGPLILHYGSEEMKQDLLPKIARGELYTCIGMSEPDSGSDLASIRSRAERVPEGWRVNGRKLWTSNAHNAHYIVALLRTGTGDESKRHAGLSQILIDLKSPGITLRPIHILSGEHQWNEITFDDVIVPADNLLGAEGQGWGQVSAELGYERSGPERYLSCMQLLQQMLDAAEPDNPRHAVAMGRIAAEIATLRQMSLGVAGILSRGENPGLAAAMVKELGTTLEQRIPEVAHDLFGIDLAILDSPLNVAMSYLVQMAPAFSLRGGTREILRGIIARGLGLR